MFEDFTDHWDSIFAGIFRFLGVDESFVVPRIHENAGRSQSLGLIHLYHRLPERLRKRLGSPFSQKQRAKLFHLIYLISTKDLVDNPVLEPEVGRKLRLELANEMKLAQEITGLDLRVYLPSS
jgi:hypothetical protein